MSLSVIYELLGLFVNTLTADNKYFLCNEKSLPQPIQMHLSKKKLSLNILDSFRNLHHILIIFKKKMAMIAHLFPKLQTAKDLVKQMSIKPHFRIPFNSQHVKGSQTLMKYP